MRIDRWTIKQLIDALEIAYIHENQLGSAIKSDFIRGDRRVITRRMIAKSERDAQKFAALKRQLQGVLQRHKKGPVIDL